LALPNSLLEALENVKGFNRATFEKIHLAPEQVTSIRLNPHKLLHETVFSFSLANKVPWNSNGYYLPERPSFTFDPLLHAGLYYVQEASSMFLEQAIKQTTNLSGSLKVLDLCAAPGGKSTLIQSIISKESLLVSNEVIKARAVVLEENMAKWGAENVVVTNNDPVHFARLAGFFDIMVVDAPCSGSGLFRKDPDAIQQWSEGAVQLCCQRQQRIIADAWPTLKENGVLIYSTCSYSKEENEDIMKWLAKEFHVEVEKLNLPDDWGIIESGGGYRFYPDKVKGEGFFIAAIRKKEATPGLGAGPRRGQQENLTRQELALVKPWLKEGTSIELVKQGDMVLALPFLTFHQLPVLQAALYIKKAGVMVGKPVFKELVPHHELALSNLANTALPRINVNFEEAIRYLRKDELALSGLSKGWAIVTYKNYSLGWVKVLPNRTNNYYPASWRILSKESYSHHNPE
jgi:16S rRNA C967 or C1407 C5-methylase (RsmB/RsmF family)/NOL1/NOP2/fmu family ribosome biogenesis protein